MKLLAVHPGPLMYTKIYVHARGGRAIDAATERFVEETRMGAAP